MPYIVPTARHLVQLQQRRDQAILQAASLTKVQLADLQVLLTQVGQQYTVTCNDFDPWFKPTPPLVDAEETTSPEAPPLQSVDDKVTCINLPADTLSDTTKSILALGPGFSISPSFHGKKKKEIKQDISDSIAEASIGVRWNAQLGLKTTAKTLDEHLKSVSPFDKKYTKPPPTEDADLENRLLLFHQKCMAIVEKTSVPSNITQEQRNAVHELRRNTELHVSIAD